METITIDDFKANTKEWLIEKLYSMPLDEAVLAICSLHDELHKYPKTCEECCKVLGIDIQFCMKYLPHGTFSYRDTLIYNLQELIICRDAYWKIAGEEMGLGKHWEPDWNEETDKFTISNKCNKIYLNNTAWYAEVLSFPTEEMRDTFYNNFKELINDCKELL